jgi:hypothetical protein
MWGKGLGGWRLPCRSGARPRPARSGTLAQPPTLCEPQHACSSPPLPTCSLNYMLQQMLVVDETGAGRPCGFIIAGQGDSEQVAEGWGAVAEAVDAARLRLLEQLPDGIEAPAWLTTLGIRWLLCLVHVLMDFEKRLRSERGVSRGDRHKARGGGCCPFAGGSRSATLLCIVPAAAVGGVEQRGGARGACAPRLPAGSSAAAGGPAPCLGLGQAQARAPVRPPARAPAPPPPPRAPPLPPGARGAAAAGEGAHGARVPGAGGGLQGAVPARRAADAQVLQRPLGRRVQEVGPRFARARRRTVFGCRVLVCSRGRRRTAGQRACWPSWPWPHARDVCM